MPIDVVHYEGPAARSDAGRLAINLVGALNAIEEALVLLSEGKTDIREQVAKIAISRAKISAHWDYLANWTNAE